jgi:hypothetical protein
MVLVDKDIQFFFFSLQRKKSTIQIVFGSRDIKEVLSLEKTPPIGF